MFSINMRVKKTGLPLRCVNICLQGGSVGGEGGQVQVLGVTQVRRGGKTQQADCTETF